MAGRDTLGQSESDDSQRIEALKQALKDQRARSAAISGIQKVINASKGDIQPVFDEKTNPFS